MKPLNTYKITVTHKGASTRYFVLASSQMAAHLDATDAAPLGASVMSEAAR